MLRTIMSNTVEMLKNRAIECERKANLTTDEAQRHTFLELAKAWREMAAAYEVAPCRLPDWFSREPF